jgi:acyl carrier protein
MSKDYPNTLKRSEIYEKVVQCLTEKLILWEVAQLTEDTNLEKLGFHTIDKDDLLFSLEESLNIHLRGLKFRECETIKQIVDLIVKQIDEINEVG